MIELSTFILSHDIKAAITKNCVYISTMDEANRFILDVSQNKLHNVIFEKSFLKSYVFSRLQDFCDINIVNCNSTLERFCESLDERITIFDNLNLCKNTDILNIVTNKKGILVC